MSKEELKVLVRKIQENMRLSVDDLAEATKIPRAKVHKLLGLYKIPMGTEIQRRVHSGEICAGCAFALAKLPEQKQYDYLREATELDPSAFATIVKRILHYG